MATVWNPVPPTRPSRPGRISLIRSHWSSRKPKRSIRLVGEASRIICRCWRV
jgi:hypothetical protein